MNSLSLRFILRFLYANCFTFIALGCTKEFLDNLKPGVYVMRGPHWKWGNQDGGIGSLGTIIDHRTLNGWVSVKWDSGHTNLYRVGFQNSCDLVIVDHNYTQCIVQPQNNTFNTAFIFPSDKTFLNSKIFNYCQRKIVSSRSDRIISFTLLWYNENSCNITVYEGSSNKGENYGNACQNKISTYHSRNNSLFVEFFLKKETDKAGFIGSIQSEEPECKEPYNKFINGGESGYIQPPYNNIILITPLKCQWALTTNSSHVFQINLVKFEELSYLDIYDGNTLIEHLNQKIHQYTTKTSMLGLFYNKPNIFSSGFILTYKAIPKAKETCPENKVYKYPGIKDQFMISTASGTDYNLPDYCHFTLHTDESSYIELNLQQLDINNSCLPSYLDMSINNLSFPSETGYSNHQVSMQAKSIHIQYLKKTQCKFLILLYVKSVTVPSCFLSPTIDVVSGPKRFLNVPQTALFDPDVKECKWTFRIKPNHILLLEITTNTSAMSAYSSFSYYDGKSWQLLLNSKMSTSQTTFQLKYKIKPRYKIWHVFGKMIIIYNSVVLDETPSTTLTEQLSRITSTSIWRKEKLHSNISMISNCTDRIITETTIPYWIYITLVLLILIYIVMGCLCWIHYKRNIYINTESFICNKNLLKHENIEI
ncbi:uncharacterized protein LOC106877781 isoform X1 [Octopus bimaculoides]|uniref:uncharacterized protein LOC106877781 isoform X1 n=2 Tax=Octopus bimaculoides TaxID=37653 RepID=UPI0022E3DFB5|nr:uncharacterized protein LOC106877781 isoform X1 [Octopus bimaculoides]XP_052823213.1 uncharacterized protein LOC106877781 isoform X1 [Octopus bimaculoides]